MLVLLSLILSAGFFATTLGSYFVSKNVIREAIIGQELPLTSSNIYVELQRNLMQPVLISSTMAHDTFLRNWVLLLRAIKFVNRQCGLTRISGVSIKPMTS